MFAFMRAGTGGTGTWRAELSCKLGVSTTLGWAPLPPHPRESLATSQGSDGLGGKGKRSGGGGGDLPSHKKEVLKCFLKISGF